MNHRWVHAKPTGQLADRLLAFQRLQRDLNRPGFAGELLVQILGCFFSRVQGFVEILFCFLWRDVSDFTV